VADTCLGDGHILVVFGGTAEGHRKEDGGNMTTRTLGRTVIALIMLLVGLSLIASSLPSSVLTTTGTVIRGSVSGIASSIRLMEPDRIASLEPVTVQEIDRSQIIQITVDFPRIVIETTTNAYVGPYSAFSGIDESLRINGADVPMAATRAIAMDGRSFRQPPRVWLGDAFLAMPSLEVASGLRETTAEPSTVTNADDEPEFDPIVWNSFTPQEPVEEEAGALPWWVGLLVVAGIVGLLLFMQGSSSSG